MYLVPDLLRFIYSSCIHQTLPAAQVIEVLLKTRAYIVKRCCTSMADKSQQGQVTWGKFGGPVHAWHVAVERAGFGEPQ